MHAWAAAGNNEPVEVVLFDGFDDCLLAGAEQVYLFVVANATFGITFAASATASTSTVAAMFVPQWHTKTPILLMRSPPSMHWFRVSFLISLLQLGQLHVLSVVLLWPVFLLPRLLFSGTLFVPCG